MKDGLAPGQSYEKTHATAPEMGIKHLGPGVPSVLSTPAMIGLMEGTCVEFLTPYMGEGEQTVGFHVDVRHTAPTVIGQKVTVKVTLQEVKETRFRLNPNHKKSFCGLFLFRRRESVFIGGFLSKYVLAPGQ